MRTSFRFVRTGRTPVAFVAIFLLLFANFWVGEALTAWGWVPAPDALHTYGIRFRGGHWRYYQPAIGWYVDRFLWLQFALMAAAGVVLWLHRGQLRRVEPPPPPSGPVSRGEWHWLLIGVPVVYSALGGAVMALLLREAGWTAALVVGLVFLAISLTTVFLAARPFLRRGPPPLEWPTGLGLAALVTLLALAVSTFLCR
jgi:hypothetical protein